MATKKRLPKSLTKHFSKSPVFVKSDHFMLPVGEDLAVTLDSAVFIRETKPTADNQGLVVSIKLLSPSDEWHTSTSLFLDPADLTSDEDHEVDPETAVHKDHAYIARKVSQRFSHFHRGSFAEADLEPLILAVHSCYVSDWKTPAPRLDADGNEYQPADYKRSTVDKEGRLEGTFFRTLKDSAKPDGPVWENLVPRA